MPNKIAPWIVVLLLLAIGTSVAWAIAEQRLLGDPVRIMSGDFRIGTGDLTSSTIGHQRAVAALEAAGNSTYGELEFKSKTAGGVTRTTTVCNPITQTASYAWLWPIGLPTSPGDLLCTTTNASPIQTAWCDPSGLGANIDHGTLAGLADDDHTQYALLAGRAGGQTLVGGTGAGDDLTLDSNDTIINAKPLISSGDYTAGARAITGETTHATGVAIYGKAGVNGTETISDAGMWGDSDAGYGVAGTSGTGQGVYGASYGGNAAYGGYFNRSYLGTWADLPDQGSDPDAAPVGKHRLYSKAGGVYVENASSVIVGPLIDKTLADGYYQPLSEARWTVLDKAADTSRTANTLLADPDLQFSGAAATKYLIRGHVYYTSAATPDFKWTLLLSSAGGATGTGCHKWIIPDALTTLVTTSNPALPSQLGLAMLQGAGTTGGYVEFDYIIITSGATTISFAWGQNTTNGTAATVQTGSYIEYKIA